MRSGFLGWGIKLIRYYMPNAVCFANGNNYVKLTITGGNYINIGDVMLTLSSDNLDAPIVLKRKVHIDNGTIVYPIDGVLVSLFSEQRGESYATSAGYVTTVDLKVTVQNDTLNLPSLVVINGAGPEMNNVMAEGNYPMPNPQKIIFYPSFFISIGESAGQVFNFNTGLNDEWNFYLAVTLLKKLPTGGDTGSGGNSSTHVFKGQAYVSFDYEYDRLLSYWADAYKVYSLKAMYDDVDRPGPYTIGNIDAEIDNCTEGIFTRWRDRYGLIRYYRWTLENETESVEVENTYRLLDSNLTPYNYDDKSRTRTFKLHSRLVDKPTRDLCKTILDGRDIQYYDNELGKWRDCYIDSVDVEDNGKNYQDLVVDIYVNELTI